VDEAALGVGVRFCIGGGVAVVIELNQYACHASVRMGDSSRQQRIGRDSVGK
jgi:hypothetical protein